MTRPTSLYRTTWLVARFVAAAGVIIGAALLAGAAAAGSASAATVSHTLSLYSLPAHETFINNDDDEQRGNTNNPFGTTSKAKGDDENGGPFPGDEALFSFKVYSNVALKTTLGSAVYTCQYHFNKTAFCDASFQLKGGTVFAAGALDFNAKKFVLAVTGGTGDYHRATGDVSSSPSGKHAQHLAFVLSG